MFKRIATFVAAVFAGVTAHAAEAVDQSQTSIDVARGYLGIGGDSAQKLAQTFRPGVTGDLVALRLPVVGCGRGDLVIEIRVAGPDGSPDGALLNTTRVDPALVPSGGRALHEFRLSAPLRVRRSAGYAFTLRMDPEAPAYCSYAHSPLGSDLYPDGSAYFDVRPNPPGWIESRTLGGQSDLGFETIVDTGPAPVARGSRNCLIPGAPAGAPPIPDSLPICRCLEDEGLREFRCALLHPDFFAIRRTPWPIELGRPYTETWEILPLTKLTAPIGVRLEGANIAKPVELSFKGLSRKSVQARAVTLKAPETLVEVKGAALLSYGQESWAIDRTLPADGLAAGATPQAPMK